VTSPRHAAAGAAACCLLAAGAAPAAACEAVLREHRSGAELMRLPLDAAQPELRIAFEHSVLGTTVVDRYRFTPRPRLVEERFDGQGYGLPHAAGPGETLQRDGAGWRLMLDRAVDPLVVRPLPAQRMRIVLADRELPLATLSSAAIEIAARGCPPPPAS
jgi:hypothetical protein